MSMMADCANLIIDIANSEMDYNTKKAKIIASLDMMSVFYDYEDLCYIIDNYIINSIKENTMQEIFIQYKNAIMVFI